MATHKRRQRTCVMCSTKYRPDRDGQLVCGLSCALRHAKARRTAKEAKARRQDAVPTITLKNRAQSAFNAYIRERDRVRLRGCCVSCGTSEGVMHCGHYRTRQAAPQLAMGGLLACLNARLQCAQCNNFKSGNVVQYRKAQQQILDPAQLDRVEHNNDTVKRSREWYLRCADIYRRRLRHLIALRARQTAVTGF